MEFIITKMEEAAQTPAYIAIAGDMDPFEALREFVPIMYVSVLPLVIVLFRLVIVPSCTPSLIMYQSYPPPAPEGLKQRGRRILRRAIMAARANARMLQATVGVWSAASGEAPWANRSAKSQKRLSAQAQMTSNMRASYGNAGLNA